MLLLIATYYDLRLLLLLTTTNYRVRFRTITHPGLHGLQFTMHCYSLMHTPLCDVLALSTTYALVYPYSFLLVTTPYYYLLLSVATIDLAGPSLQSCPPLLKAITMRC